MTKFRRTSQRSALNATPPAALSTQLFRFILTGVLSACVDFGVLWILTQGFGFSQPLGKSVSFVFGTITAYAINRRWTFAADPSKRRFGAILLLYGLTFALQVGLYSLLFWLLDGWWGSAARDITMVVCFVIAQGVATVVNFTVQRVLIFRHI